MLNLNEKEQRKFNIIKKVVDKQITKKEASTKLELSIRQINRLIIKYNLENEKGFIHKNKGKTSNKKISDVISNQIINIYLEEYSDYNFSHFYDEIGDKLNVSKSTVFRVLTDAEIISPEAQHKTIRLYNETMKKSIKSGKITEQQKQLYLDRQELEQQKYVRKSTLHYNFGQEVQMDAAFYIWFGSDTTALHLAVDKATKKVLYGWFDYQETSKSYYILLMNTIINYGIPKSIKTDRRRSFSINDIKLTQSKVNITQFERICNELEIELYCSSNPVFKPNVERENKTFKGRLKAELRHKNITTMDEANKYLNTIFIPKMNNKFSYSINRNKNDMRDNKYTKEELNIIISERYERIIDNASSIKYKNDYYLLVDDITGDVVSYPSKTKCTLVIAYDGTYKGIVNNQLYSLVKIEKIEEEKTLNNPKDRKYFQGRKPASNHPWAYHKKN